MNTKKKIIIIGLGNQTVKDHIPSILRRNDLEIVAAIDTDQELLNKISSGLKVVAFSNIEKAIEETKPDLAFVAVPHDAYLEILKILANRKIPTLKEKPLAMNYVEAKEVINLYAKNDTYLQICVQRRFSKLYKTTKELLNKIEKIYSIYIEYALNLDADAMATGWRSDRKISGGGAVIDMGYHIIDLLTYIFGVPDKIYAQLNYNTLGNNYSIEDTMKAMMSFSNRQINANVLLTKIFNQKSEEIHIIGTNGTVKLSGRKVSFLNSNSDELESHSFATKDHEVDAQLDYFIKNSDRHKNNKLLSDQLINMAIIDAIYKSDKEEKVIKNIG
jgi:predicted dehydrogenase